MEYVLNFNWSLIIVSVQARANQRVSTSHQVIYVFSSVLV